MKTNGIVSPAWGSSPLTRGKPPLPHARRFGEGLIPAHAGKTARDRASGAGPRAHPRSRGENRGLIEALGEAQGSSPLTRGKLRPGIRAGTQHGLIPAHAGKTGPTSPCPLTPRAHPRSRGENALGITTCMPAPGSSPLTRGKPTRSPRRTKPGGLIPAHAGKTHWGSPSGRPLRAHPRSRGENLLHDRVSTAGGGSSPLTRGKRVAGAWSPKRVGLIPAHAGKTKRSAKIAPVKWAHPRSRGENGYFSLISSASAGSSPLTRGKRCG